MQSIYKVLLNQTIITHYREPFFSKLANHSQISLTIAAGTDNYGLTSSMQSNVSGAVVTLLKNVWFFNKNFLWQSKLLELCKYHEIIILPFNIRTISVAFILIKARLQKKRVILWGHSSGRSRSKFVRKLRKLYSRMASSIIVYSSQNRTELVELGVPKEKIFVAPNSIDVDKIRELRTSEVTKSLIQKNCIIFAGRLIPIKKVDLLIRSFSRCLSRLPDHIKLTIIGDGPEMARLQHLTKNLQIANRVDFTGTIVDEVKLSEHFKHALFAANPGHIGLFAIHAMAYGLPVLVADRDPHAPEFEALIPKVNCMFFPSDSEEALAEGIVELISNSELLSTLSAGADKTVEQYGVTKMVQAFEDAINYSVN